MCAAMYFSEGGVCSHQTSIPLCLEDSKRASSALAGGSRTYGNDWQCGLFIHWLVPAMQQLYSVRRFFSFASFCFVAVA